ncbi:acylneuraminate cytidylyltransferase [Novosphingobium sp. ST904]|uniref:acylneuraminate cytidylyltransferase n=1 Tax=Novosphingobium sp. ST904 TaxID=1684385 RepID=UPI000AB38450|nr:acylneuraminate cytidylyltransferase [Novosphingobium sp. ST904]TCM37305.1 N-acylneuraminate cytidylyltransferase [Novosphingobium sp. ST904]
MQTLAIIPARGGSKGIPRKNVLPLLDKPLIAHTIHAALLAESVDRVVVSTDDEEIASVSRAYGAEVIMRPPELASDMAKSEDALLHVLDHLDQTEGYRPDLLVFLQCTSPLTSSGDIDGTVGKLIEEQADTALSVVPFHYFLWHGDEQSGADGVNHDKSFRLMRQQRTPEFVETGSVYVMKVPQFRDVQFRFFGRTAMHEIPVEHWQEIDEPADFRIAEDRIRRLRRDAVGAGLPARVRALIMDFDGVHTDDRVLVSTSGEEAVSCSRSDGMGIELLRKAGLAMTVISKEQNKVVAARCAKLQIECTHGVETKLPLMLRWLAQKGIAPEEAVYVGNDVNDLECMAAVGCSVAPADAHPRALAAAGIVLERSGGRGALRELAELLLDKGCVEAVQ